MILTVTSYRAKKTFPKLTVITVQILNYLGREKTDFFPILSVEKILQNYCHMYSPKKDHREVYNIEGLIGSIILDLGLCVDTTT